MEDYNIVNLIDKYKVPIAYISIEILNEEKVDIFDVLKGIFFTIRTNNEKFKSKYKKLDICKTFLAENEKYKLLANKIVNKHITEIFEKVYIDDEDNDLVFFGDDIEEKKSIFFQIVKDIKEDRDFTLYRAVYSDKGISEMFYNTLKSLSDLLSTEHVFNKDNYNLFIFARKSIKKESDEELLEAFEYMLK